MPFYFNPYGNEMQYYAPESPNLTFGQEYFTSELDDFDPNTMPNVTTAVDDEENDKPNTSASYAEAAAADAAADAADGNDPASPKKTVPQVVPGFDL